MTRGPWPDAGVLETWARAALVRWTAPVGAAVRLITISENASFRVTTPDGPWAVLRLYRPGRRRRREIDSELAWMTVLAAAGAVVVPGHFHGRDGAVVQSLPGPDGPRHWVLFHHLAGQTPGVDGDLTGGFEVLGEIAARLHLHTMAWSRPAGFSRGAWDLEAIFGQRPRWGDWRDGPKVTVPVRAVLERVEACLRRRLTDFGQAPRRFGLIHADMRLANLLVDGAAVRLIDFDDCGFGWFLYDLAAALSFMEDDPRVPALKSAWLAGYQNVRPLTAADLAEVDSFIMLRRMALLAWIGSHGEAPEPQALAAGFAEATAALGETWLAGL